MHLSLDLRQRIVAAYKSGEHTVRRIAKNFSVAKATVQKLVRRERKTGSIAPQKAGRPAFTFWDDQNIHTIVRDMVAEDNQATLAEYCVRLKERTGTRVSVPQMCGLLQQLKLYRKKKSLQAAEGDCPRVEQMREEWQEKTRNIDANRFVFVDETGINRGMTRRYARAEGEARAHGCAPKNPGGNVSVIGSISLSLDERTTAMSVTDSVDGDVFHVYVKDILCPTLRSGDIVVMDNCSIHKDERIPAVIKARGAELWFLPPYSPKLNPIEESWSKVKTILRTIAARTKEALDEGLTYALGAITVSDAQGWFEHGGYTISSA